jgi:hypothetical protein
MANSTSYSFGEVRHNSYQVLTSPRSMACIIASATRSGSKMSSETLIVRHRVRDYECDRTAA